MTRLFPPQQYGTWGAGDEASLQRNWAPAVDIFRQHDGWLLKFELAGVRAEDVQLTVSGRSLSIQGVRRDDACCAARQSYCLEISYNRFQRVIEFPCELERARVSTEFRNGMLLVQLHLESQG